MRGNLTDTTRYGESVAVARAVPCKAVAVAVPNKRARNLSSVAHPRAWVTRAGAGALSAGDITLHQAGKRRHG